MAYEPVPIPLVDGNTLFIDNSSLERFVTCPRSAEYYIGRRRELDRSRAALEFGRIIHEALAVRYARFPGYVSNECVTAMVAELDRGFATYHPDEDEFRNYGVAVAAIREYNAQYAMEEFEVEQFNGKPFVEQPFAIPLGVLEVDADLTIRDPLTKHVYTQHTPFINLVWQGRIDLVYRANGGLYGMDHKTTSIMGPGFFKEFELSHQVHGYAWAIRKLCGALPRGFVINGLGIRKQTRTGKALEFVRSTIPIYDSLVAEWETDTLHIVADYIEMSRRGYLPKHTKWCVGKYGECEFRQVCTLEPSMRNTALASNEYRDVTWDPLK